MDYCSWCRRNLNGALVCPDCGAYAPDIAPPPHRLHSRAPSTAPMWETHRAQEPTPESYPGVHCSDVAPIDTGASEDAAVDASGAGSPNDSARAAPTTQGRAARRRQLARWKKNRRRAVAATAVALVGGGLTVAALPTGSSTGRAQATSALEPGTAAPPPTESTDSSSAQSDPRDSRHPGTRPPMTTSRRQTATVDSSSAEAASGQPKAATTAHPTATPSAASYTTSDSGNGLDGDQADATTSEATAPASTDRSEAGTSAESPEPIKVEPTQVCLLGTCVG